VMLKASAGGGGIGIVKVDNEEEMEKALESVRRLAKSSFGDDAVFIEKYVDDPRHVEYQVIGDKEGNIIHLNERECSVQRRNQKLIEETPSCVLTPEMRAEMGEQAVLAAKTAKYYNAGTCEFMYAQGKDGEEDKYYFLEMNTRLQVEHPITEECTGVDLAVEMLRVASNLPLQYRQEDIRARGHAIECRINAEDPLHNFMPSPGKISRYAEPSGPGVRIDSGVYQGFEIPTFYDSMVSKLIVWAENRDRCIERTKRALWEYQIGGIRTNIPFHHVVMNDSVFRSGNYTTSYIPRYDLMNRTVKYIEEQKALTGGGKKVAAAMAGVQAQISAINSGQ
ncbi:MAG TPA: acetyl-CoA carboxylase biotin carboxylase subunit, partial [Euryarchaeota archaeon]|nr:acetyl-CoA carboxylase biotin carboxylase subunit [Euryarchaeota archaeon]